MRRKQDNTERPISLRRCASNQIISMESIPQFSSEPYFVRKQYQQSRLQRGSSTSRKNKLIESKKNQNSKERLIQSRNQFTVSQREEIKVVKLTSPIESQKPLEVRQFQNLGVNNTNFKMTENVSDQNFSDQKTSSCKSVRFSNRLNDNKTTHSRRDGSRTPSILKHKNKKYPNGLSSIPSERSFSINNSFHSNHKEIKKKTVEESNSNSIIKKKYQAIMQTFQNKEGKNKPPLPGRKYFKVDTTSKKQFQDDIFPPLYSSIFPPNPRIDKLTQRKGKQIEWKRISQIFPNQKLVIFDRPQSVPKFFDSTKQQSKVAKIIITKQKNSYASEFIITAFNAIKNNEDLMCKFFEDQEINDSGIYLIKIFQQNVWKYIIIDDFIPVVRSNLVSTSNPFVPAFINVNFQAANKDQKTKKIDNQKKLLPVWPLLLEKAYANYYSSYEALTHGNVLDMVQQLCGISYEKVSLVQKTDAEEYLQVIDKLLNGLKNGNVVVLAQLKDQLPMIPLYYKAQFCYSMITEEELLYYDPHEEYQPSRIKFYDLGLICTHLFLFFPTKYLYQVTSTISKPRHKVSPSLITRINNEEKIVPRDIPTVRKFVVKSACECSIFIRQKEKRFLYRLGVKYIWLRCILVAKEYDGSFRWIDGQYSNNKTIIFSYSLDSGEYFIILYPEWTKEKYHHQIYATVFCNEGIEPLERVIFDSKQKVLEQACTDLAQKRGKLKQLNQYICTYNFVDKKSAMIIQNINNQRLQGQVNIVRSIIGLKCQVDIVPANDQFYENLTQQKNEQGVEFLAIKKTTIDVKIPKSECFTVILKMKGGIDNLFFKAFTFGS